MALALAQASGGSVTALHVTTQAQQSWQRRLGAEFASGTIAEAILLDIAALGNRSNVSVRTLIRRRDAAESAILGEATAGKYDLIVLGVGRRPGKTLSFGTVSAALIVQSDCSMLFVAS